MPMNCALIGAAALLLLTSRAARVILDQQQQARAEVAKAWEDFDLEVLGRKQGAGDNATFDLSIAGGNAIGRLHLAFSSVGAGGARPRITNQGFAGPSMSGTYWKPGSILGKDDDTVWPIAPEGSHAGPAISFTFDHGVSDLVFGDLLDGEDVFHRMEFDELVYKKVKEQRGPFFAGGYEQSADEAVAEHLRKEVEENTLALGTWHSDGYFTPGSERISYVPRLRARKAVWEDVGGRFRKVTMQRPSIMDIDNLFVEDPEIAAGVGVRTSMQVNRDDSYQGRGGQWPNLGKCKASRSFVNQLLATSGKVIGRQYHCGRAANEQCTTREECETLGGRWKEKYCDAAGDGSSETCGCCKEIGTKPPAPRGGDVSAQLYVEWIAPLLKKHLCVPLEAKWAKAGASSVFIAMGWGTESDNDLDIDLSLVPLTKGKKAIKDKVVYFNSQVPKSLACSRQYGMPQGTFAMRAFADDRSGDSPGDDEMVKVNLACLSQGHPDIDAVAVVANIYKPARLTWNMLDSVYMRFVAGGQERQHGDNFFVQDAESIASFVRLTADATKADPSMENRGLVVGMLFKDAEGDWAFAGLMEGVGGQTALHSIPQIESLMQGFSYPISEDWDDAIDAATGENKPKTAKCVEKHA